MKKNKIDENITVQYYEEIVKSYLHDNLSEKDQKQFEADLQTNFFLKNELDRQITYHQALEENKDNNENCKRSVIGEFTFFSKNIHYLYLVLIILSVFLLVIFADIRYN